MQAEEILNLDNDVFKAMLVGYASSNQIDGLLAVLQCIGNIKGKELWLRKDEKLKAIADVYVVIASFVVGHYEYLSCKKEDGYGFWGILREMNINYLNYVGCVCGKPFSDVYFEEEMIHIKCELYREWAWRHLPEKMRNMYFGDF